jgi:hypothetical protein
LASYKYTIFFELFCQTFVHLVVIATPVTPAFITSTSVGLPMPTAALVVIRVAVSHFQFFDTVGPSVVLVMLPMGVFFAVAFRVTSAAIRAVASSISAGVAPTFRLAAFTITSSRVGGARRVGALRLIHGLVSRTMAAGVIRTVVVVPFRAVTSSRTAIP